MPLYEADAVYLTEAANLLDKAQDGANTRKNRTDQDTVSHFGAISEYSLTDYKVPMLGSKAVSFHAILHELVWMLSGDSSIKYLLDNNVHIWDEWLVPGTEVRDADGKLLDARVSALYGQSWRKWKHIEFVGPDQVYQYNPVYTTLVSRTELEKGSYETYEVDQIAMLIHTLRTNPMSRRMLLSAWNPGLNDTVTLPACHSFAQFYVEKDNSLSCMFYMRSSDHFLGKPFNIVGYAILTHILAHLTGRTANTLICAIGDQHLYLNHKDALMEQFDSADKMDYAKDPSISISKELTDIDLLIADMITLNDYTKGPVIKAPVAV